MLFHDLFSEKAELYASARPQYPQQLFEFLASLCPVRERAWDCGTGNGQAALGLAEHFRFVEATDASEAQIANAYDRNNIRYSVQNVEATSFATESFDAVCTAQALHWFHLATFFPEVQRVLKPGGIFAAWGYNWFHINESIDSEFQGAVLDVVAPYWAPQNQLMWDGYRDVRLPFKSISTPEFHMNCYWNLLELLAFVHTWSAVRRCMAEKGNEFFERAVQRLQKVWGSDDLRRPVLMPIVMIAGIRQ